MYIHAAPFYDALYSFQDTPAAVREVKDRLKTEAPHARRLLDVGCGTGRHAELLKDSYDVEGLDLNPQMLEVARERCPDLEFHEADMSDFSLEGRFDAIISLFSSIAHVKTRERMRSTIACMRRHLNTGGVVLVEPWFTPEDYWTGTITANFVDQPELKIAWMYTSEREGDVSKLDIHYLVGRPEGVESFTELHEMGLWTRDEYLDAFRHVGLEARHESGGPFGRGLYVAKNPEPQP